MASFASAAVGADPRLAPAAFAQRNTPSVVREIWVVCKQDQAQDF